ncbi:MAG: class I tRNA ligase family protein, partial [Nanoarchaeota archaeon]|nr:class I tRNA ligase family protein [Nanoarchaeota archaeon]
MRELEIRNLLFKVEDFEHDYPFCWRCGTPLLYYAKNSWFIKMSAVNKELLENNQKVNWVPEHIKEGRFGQWLKESKDWAFSRERYWGTPLPIWECNQCDNKNTIGSIKELEKLSIGSKNTYYVMRHGLTTRDELGVGTISTRLENDTYHLTDEGRVGVERSLELLKLDDIDFIYASPFIRTQETAVIVGKILHKEVKTDERISEMSVGLAYEGKGQSVYTIEHKHSTMDSKSLDGESFNDVRKRLMEFMVELDIKYHNKKILIVSHCDPLWLLNTMATGLEGDTILTNTNEAVWYPKLAEIHKLSWRKIPRNEYGELDLHRPFVDNIILKCAKCKSKMRKIPDLIDVWFDSGAMPYAQWHWPFENKKMFKEQFPADFIVEAMDQTRGWFYTLLAISTLLEKGAPYKNVMVLGHTLDLHGKKMSKSLGNTMLAIPAMEQYGADTLRWYFFSMVSIGESKAVIPKEIEEKIKGFFGTLGNCVRFYELYGQGAEAFTHNSKAINLLDKWILSKFNVLVGEVSDVLDKYDPTPTAKAIEKF